MLSKGLWGKRFLLFFLLQAALPVALDSPARANGEASVFRVALPDPVTLTTQDVASGAPVVVRLLGLSAPWQTEVVERLLTTAVPPAQVTLMEIHFEKGRPAGSAAVWTVKKSAGPSATRTDIVDSLSWTRSPEGNVAWENACPQGRKDCYDFLKALKIETLPGWEVRLSSGTLNELVSSRRQHERVNTYRPAMNHGFE